MTLKDLCDIKTNFPEADFWLRSTGNKIGEPHKDFKSEDIGIKVIKIDKLVPDYLYYLMQYFFIDKKFASFAQGELKKLTVKQIQNIPVQSM